MKMKIGIENFVGSMPFQNVLPPKEIHGLEE
jgi:hypothetical protein